MRKPSRASQRDLARLLRDIGLSGDALERLLPGGAPLPRLGPSLDDLLVSIEFLANRGELTADVLDLLAAEYPGRADDFGRLRVDMEFVPPTHPLVSPPDLDGMKGLARRAGLHDGLPHARLAAGLDLSLRVASATSLTRVEQLDAWFDAANRQRLEPGDRAWMLDLLERAVEVGNPPGKAELGTHLNRVRLIEPTDLRNVALTDDDKGSLQQIVRTYGIMLSAGDFLETVANGLARTCLVRIAGQDAGTAFLVGDDLALTAHHVLAPVLSGGVAPSLVEFQFDYRDQGGKTTQGPTIGLALAGVSVQDPQPWLVDASPPAAEEMKKDPKPDVTVPTSADELDFALVRLADRLGTRPGPAGPERGHFAVSPAAVPYDFPAGAALMIFGHPLKEGGGAQASPQVFSIEPNAVIAKNPNLTRVRYGTNTRRGSSGSPVLTGDGRVVALHHFGRPGDYNQGIPMAAIVTRPRVADALVARAAAAMPSPPAGAHAMILRPSKASLQALTNLLYSVGMSGKDLESCLPPGVPPQKEGDDLETWVRVLGGRGYVTQELLDEIEKKYGKLGEDLKRLRRDMDFMPPPAPLFDEDELKRFKTAARRGGLHEDLKFAQVKRDLPKPFLDVASTAIYPEDQMEAWFKAAARQVLQEGDTPWIVVLVTIAAKYAEGQPKTDLTRWLAIIESGAPPWKLSNAPAPVAPPVTPPVGPAAPVTGRSAVGYALVIGVREYAHARAAADPGAVREFTNLKYARKDAEDFSAFLEAHADIDFAGRVQRVVDKEATRERIMQELDTLRQRCAESAARDPLTIVYFSGHGMSDRWRRHYLMPHDGDPDRLFSTALWNRTFDCALDELPTQRLVVLLDACHAGSMPLDGTKKGTLLQYDPTAGLDLQPQKGRYFIASCSEGEWSYEVEENGIFTKHLLELLQCEGVEQPELDLADLYRALRLKVSETARVRCEGASQQPTANISDSGQTGVILAINRRGRARLRPFLDAIKPIVRKSQQTRQPVTLIARLEDFVDDNIRSPDVDPDFYDLFLEGVGRWKGPADVACAEQVAKDLAKKFDRGSQSAGTTAGDQVSARAPATTSPARSDFVQPAAPGRSDHVQPAAAVRSDQLQSPPSIQRRLFADQDRDAILSALPAEPSDYDGLRMILSRCLKEGVTQDEFKAKLEAAETDILDSAMRRAETDEERRRILGVEKPLVAGILAAIGSQFDNRWNIPTNAINLRAGFRG